MGLLDKFFKKKNTLAGDAKVPILLQSIAVGADPTTQVSAIKAITDKMKIAGDAKTTWDGYLAELATCKNETLETKALAIAEVSKYWESICGDASEGNPESPAADPDDADTKPNGKADDATASGDSLCTGKEGCTCPKCKPPVPAAGDAIDERFNKIEASLNQLTQAVGQLVASGVTAPGDAKTEEVQKEEPTTATEPGSVTTTLGGDQKTTESKKQTVSDFMANLRG